MTKTSPRRVDLPAGVPVRILSALHRGKGSIVNVSATGAYVATPMVLLPQAHVRLQIVIREEKRWVEAEAVVAWENRGTVARRDGLPPGYGLRFLRVPEETGAYIEELLAAAVAPPVAAEAEPAYSPSEETDGPPYRLREDVVRARTPDGAPGIFVLSYDRTQDARVGRSDDNLRSALVGFEGQYAYFYFEPIQPTEDRYFRECELYHRLGGDHGQLDNTEHPLPPTGFELPCPVCVAERVR